MSAEDQLLEYALGLLSDAEMRTAEARLRDDPAARDVLAEVFEGLAVLEGPMKGRAPSENEEDRLHRALGGIARFLPFVKELGLCFDLSMEGVHEALELMEATGPWQSAGVPGVEFVHFRAGPRLAGADTGFVRLAPNARFPEHEHRGPELTYLLEGVLYVSTGEILRPGDQLRCEVGERHGIWAGDSPVLYATYHRGFDIVGEPP